jgi:hypothetical protein
MRVGSGRTIPDEPRMTGTLAAALPPILPTLGHALIWGLVGGLCALTSVMLGGWETPAKIRTIFLLFSLGGVLAFPVGLFLARLLSDGAKTETAFAAAFLSLAVTTIAGTAGLFGLQYREYYAQWHADAFTWIWFLQFTYTMAAALYQFAALGMRLYFPFGFVALIAVSLWFARSPR